MVHLEGTPTRSCQTSLASVAGKRITTIEGLSGRIAEAVQSAWDAHQVPQCGYCQSGQVMTATALLTANAEPDEAAIQDAMSGHLCRCGTYGRVKLAIQSAAKSLVGQA